MRLILSHNQTVRTAFAALVASEIKMQKLLSLTRDVRVFSQNQIKMHHLDCVKFFVDVTWRQRMVSAKQFDGSDKSVATGDYEVASSKSARRHKIVGGTLAYSPVDLYA